MPSAPRQLAATMRERLARRFWLDDSLPRPVRRANHLAVLAILAVIPFMVTMLVHDFTTTTAPIASRWYILLNMAMFLAVISLKHRARGVAHRASGADHLLCPGCTYDLRTLGATGTCPECGRAYEHDAVRATWLDAERRLKRK